MPTYHYQSHIQQQNTDPAFAEGNTPTGHYWLAVVAGQKKEVLLNQLSPLLGSAIAPTAPQIEQTLEQFYDWFREAYQQAKGVECPLPDEQILAGVGLVWVDPQGQATLYSLRSSSLCCLQHDKLQSIEKGYQQRQLQAGDLLIADPGQGNITLAVVNAYRQGGYSWEALTTTSYNFPVAVLQVTGSEAKPAPEPPTPKSNVPIASDKPTFPIGRVLVFITLIGGLLAFGYFYLVAIDSVPPHVTDDVQPDSTSTSPVKSRPQAYLDLPFAEMAYVPGGTFQMGDTRGEGFSDEKPVHTVTVSSFLMGKYEVTQRQWEAVMGSNPSYFKDCPDCPVEQVSWDDVQLFLQKLNARTAGGSYRLPTEAEWEYAAGGGSGTRTRFGNGRDVVDPSEVNLDASARTVYKKQPYSVLGKYRQKTVRVGSFVANRLGLHDMSGNVFEWCSNWYKAYSGASQSNPTGPATGSIRSLRVLRRGSWINGPQYVRVAYRNDSAPSYRRYDYGFRVVSQAQ